MFCFFGFPRRTDHMLGAQNRFLEIAIGGFSRSADLHPAVAFAVPHRFRLPDKPLFAICFPQVIIPIPATCAHLHPSHPLSVGTCIAGRTDSLLCNLHFVPAFCCSYRVRCSVGSPSFPVWTLRLAFFAIRMDSYLLPCGPPLQPLPQDSSARSLANSSPDSFSNSRSRSSTVSFFLSSPAMSKMMRPL